MKTSPRGETTREALLEAATVVFAREGFPAANLRGIAERAGVNPALIGYHFQNKEGLYLAVFTQWVANMRACLEPAWAVIAQALDGPEPQGPPETVYLEPLLALVDGMVAHIVMEHPAWGELMVREQQSPSAAFDILFEGIIGPNQRALVALLQRLRPGFEGEKVRLIAGMIVSQVLVFRNARLPLMRLMDWAKVGPRELDAVRALIRRNTQLLVLGD